MIRPALGALVSLAIVASAAAQAPKPIEEATLRNAAGKPLALVQKSQRVSNNEVACTSCHHEILPVFLFEQARERGFAFDSALAGEIAERSVSHLKDLDALVQGHNYIDVVDDGWKLLAAHTLGVPPSTSTSLEAQFLASNQRPDGSWWTMDSRPPQSHSRFTMTAVCARAVSLYMPKELQAEKEAVLRRAREWFLKAQPATTEDRTFQLLGLLWTGADETARKHAAKQLLAEQRKDGGWSQLKRLESDAYATGEVLYALHNAAGFPTTDPIYQNGLRFLLKSQEPDGSWLVKTRLDPNANISPRYFDPQFPRKGPEGRYHKFSSIMGSEWATMAILQAIPPKKDAKPKPPPPDVAPTEKAAWVAGILNGSADDLRKALAGGLKPDVKTAKGTTALMLAARDPEKVKVLIAAGADVNVRAESGYTALVVASRYPGNSETLRALLEKKADVNAAKDAKVVNDASALFWTAGHGDREMARMLIQAGGDMKRGMRVLGSNPRYPLMQAAQRGDAAMAELLIASGADPDDISDPDDMSALEFAVMGNHPETVSLLLKRGAKVNHVDKAGFTPLLAAVLNDHGDTAVLELLLAAGADRSVKDPDGRTALEVAKQFKHTAMVEVLEGKKAPANAPCAPIVVCPPESGTYRLFQSRGRLFRPLLRRE